jgi:hypothetical protein
MTSNHVLEHVRDVCSTLERVRQAMKPGGRVVIKLPFDDVHERKQRGWSRDDLDFHLHTFTVRNFANVLFESGYDVERCEVITSCWHPRLFPLEEGRPRQVRVLADGGVEVAEADLCSGEGAGNGPMISRRCA